jgi:acyl-CoA thioesterase FadM
MSADHTLRVSVSFGHCDPAGIVFYPNYFRWFDQCFHEFLRVRAGGHRHLCQVLNAKGIGLMDVGADFTSPTMEGDVMALHLSVTEWGKRTLSLAYRGEVEGRIVVKGRELRGLFVERDGRLRAGEMAPLRGLLFPD